MTPDRRYELKWAVQDLIARNLLSSVLVFRGGAWLRHRVEGAHDAVGDLSFHGAVLDSRAVGAGQLFLGLSGERVDGRNYVGVALRAGAAAALTRPWSEAGADPLLSGDPGHDAAILLSDDPDAALTVLAACWRRRCTVGLVAVTGTNGKTTTKDLLAALLTADGPTLATSGNYNNALGVPLTLLGLRAEHRWAVIEMGASGPGEIADLAALAAPRVGVITNASGAHLEGFGDLETIVRTKGELLDHLPEDGVAVLNADSAGFDAWRRRARCSVVSWGETAGDHRWSWSPAAASDTGVLTIDGEAIPLPLPGRHNAANLCAAVIAARALAGPDLDIAGWLSHLRTSPHRSRLLTVAGITVLDDTYNANPASVLAAGRALMELSGTGRTVVVLGSMAELGAEAAELHRDTGAALAELGFDAVWAVGLHATDTAEGAVAAGAEGRVARDVEEAAAMMIVTLVAGDHVLVKGSRSAGMERVVELFRTRREPDMSHLERS